MISLDGVIGTLRITESIKSLHSLIIPHRPFAILYICPAHLWVKCCAPLAGRDPPETHRNRIL